MIRFYKLDDKPLTTVRQRSQKCVHFLSKISTLVIVLSVSFVDKSRERRDYKWKETEHKVMGLVLIPDGSEWCSLATLLKNISMEQSDPVCNPRTVSFSCFCFPRWRWRLPIARRSQLHSPQFPLHAWSVKKPISGIVIYAEAQSAKNEAAFALFQTSLSLVL